MIRPGGARRALSACIVVLAALVLGGCRVDVTVLLDVEPDGTGTLTVTAVADADVVEAAPGLADDLRLDDLVEAGWEIDGPTTTPDGGLEVAVSHGFSTPEEAVALLATLNGVNGPFQQVQLTRTQTDDAATFTLDGAGRIDAGLAAFADPALLAAVGATPYAADIAEAALSPAQAFGLVFVADLPGSVDSTTSTAEDGTLSWTIPLDGSSVPFATTVTQRVGREGPWKVVADVALGALVVWIVLSTVFIGYVVLARRRRANRRGSVRRFAP